MSEIQSSSYPHKEQSHHQIPSYRSNDAAHSRSPRNRVIALEEEDQVREIEYKIGEKGEQVRQESGGQSSPLLVVEVDQIVPRM